MCTSKLGRVALQVVALAIPAALCSSGCAGSSSAASGEEQPLTTMTDSDATTASAEACSDAKIASSAAYTLDRASATVATDTLTVTVAAQKQCSSDVFYACWQPIFRDSDPPQAVVNLVRRSDPAGCSIHPISQVVAMDLQMIRSLYLQVSTPDTNGTVAVELFNPSLTGGGASLLYTF